MIQDRTFDEANLALGPVVHVLAQFLDVYLRTDGTAGQNRLESTLLVLRVAYR